MRNQADAWWWKVAQAVVSWGKRAFRPVPAESCPSCAEKDAAAEHWRSLCDGYAEAERRRRESCKRCARLLRKRIAEARAEPLTRLEQSALGRLGVTDADLAAASGTLLAGQQPRYALQPRVVDLRAVDDALAAPVSEATTGGPWKAAELHPHSAGPTSPPPALYRPPDCSCRCHETPEEPSGPLPYAEVARMWPNPCKGPLPEATVAMAKRMAHERPGGSVFWRMNPLIQSAGDVRMAEIIAARAAGGAE